MKSSPRSRRLASPIPLFFLLAALMPADRAPAQPGGPAMVTVAPVQRQTIEQELRLSGTMRPRRYSRVSAEVAGKALEVSADAGDFVQEGDPLLRLETRPTELMLAEATANFRLRQAELAELKAGSRSEDIAMNQAELENSRARLSLAESELQRVETLLERRAVSRGDFDKVKAEADRSRAEVAQREAELGRAVAGSREEEILAAQAQVEAAAARADQLRDALDRHIVRAPFAGVVGQKMTEEGEWVRVGDPLFALADARDLYIEVNAPERHFNQIRADASATVEFDAAGSETVQGRVSRIVPLVDAASRTFPVRIDIDNSRLTVAPGMFGRASLKLSAATASGEAEPSQDALVVPKDAVVLDPGGKRKVWLVRPAGPGTKAFPVEVKTGRQHLDMIEILEGELREGDVAVIRGNERLLFPGQDVVIENPAPQPEAR